MLKEIIEQAKSMFKNTNKTQTYSSALEAYIVSHNPQNTHDIEHLERQFDQRQANRGQGWLA